MYSNSAPFLSGANSSRPGQYQQPYQQQSTQQPSALNQQATGLGGTPQLQLQYTGFPGQLPLQNFQQQSQQTSYPSQSQQQSYGQNLTPFGQTPNIAGSPNRTGQMSTQIAQSLQTTGASQVYAPKSNQSGVKIPKIRLSFLTAQDQAKFEQLFKSAVGDGQALDGKDLMVFSLSGC